MKKLFVFTLAIVCSFAKAQELPDLTPISPEAASIGKYGQIPVGLFTGTPQINVPIHTFKSGSLTVPVSLNYSSNGVRVDEYASSVGLGWNLSAGGVITRSVNGHRDENQYIPAKDTDLDFSVDQYNFVTAATGSGNNAVDTQPDIFSFSFNGYSGKFYLGDNSSSFWSRDVVFLEPSPLKIEVLNVHPETHFKITDPTGVIYYFGGDNAIEKFKHQASNQADASEGPIDIATAWYLTKMSHPSGDEIAFLYEKGGASYTNGISQSISKENSITQYGEAPRFCNIQSGETAYLTFATGNFSYLTEISSVEAGKINFEYAQKAQMPNGFKKLNRVSIKDVHLQDIKSFELNYLITGSNGPTNDDIIAQEYYNKRYFLSSVTEVAKNGDNLPPHTFTYISPEELPSRFSYAQDYWGFYNGKSLNENLIDQTTIDALSGNYLLSNALSSFKAADRTPNPSFAKKGLLKEVIYPLGGSNELTYEGHAYYGEVKKYPPITSRTADVAQNVVLTSSFDIPSVDFDHKGFLSFKANLDDFHTAEDGTFTTIDFNIALVEIYDLTTGQIQPVYGDSDINGENPFMTPYGVYSGNFSRSMYVKLKKGHAYRFSIQLDPNYSLSGVTLRYYDAPMIVTEENIPVGGMRLQQVNTLNGSGKIEVKKYHYGPMDCLDCDSGSVFNRNLKPTVINSRILFCASSSSGGGDGNSGDGPNGEEDNTNSGGGSHGGSVGSGGSGNSNGAGNTGIGPQGSGICSSTNECSYTTISASTLFSLYAQGYHIGYSSVVEELGNDFKGGAIHHEFESSFSIEPAFTLQGDYIAGIRNSNFFGFGRNKGVTSYIKKDNQFQKVSETKNSYSKNDVLDSYTDVYVVRREAEMKENFSFVETEHFTFQNNLFAIAQYSLKTQWHTMSKRVSMSYDRNGENPITTTEDFYYDNSQHLQQTRTETIDSKGRLIKTQTTYPQDIPAASRTVAEQKLIDLHQIATPIDIVTSEKEGSSTKTISKVHTAYQDWGNNLILPKEVETSKKISALDLRVAYTSYDSFGNPQEVSKATGAPMVYIWGYHHQYPVAKLENITYDEVQSYVADLQTKSNADIDRTVGALGTEGALRTALNNLRNALPDDVMVSTYTYDPMIGVTSMTDPRGYTVYYEYDSHNRLEYVRDEEGKLISENKYHFKN